MVDLVSDFSQAYEDFGTDASVNYSTEPVKLMFDEELNFDDMYALRVRALVTTPITKNDLVLMKGITYTVMKISPYGDQQEENIVSLNKQE